jgi:hypothetical protein
VGTELPCSVTVGRTHAAGRALLEATKIIFRPAGAESPIGRLNIPLASITALDASNGKLRVTHVGGRATFDLGDQAEVWASKIRNPKSVIEKLGVRPGMRVVVLAAGNPDFVDELRAAGADVSTNVAKNVDIVFVGAETLAKLAGLRRHVDAIKRDGAIWTVTPKGKGGIKDTDVMGIARAAGLVAVKVVSFSGTHSANKFVIPRSSR